MGIDFNDIALFVHVVKAGSFVRGGQQLGIPPSTGSRRIQMLEKQVGVRLLQRSTRRLVLTEAGEAFYAECVGQVDSLFESYRQIADQSAEPRGRVRVAAPADFFNWFPLAEVTTFLESYPKIRLDFVLNDARVDLLRDGIDLAIRAGHVAEPTVVVRRIGATRSMLVASPRYLQTIERISTPEDLANADCILPTGSESRAAIWRLDGNSAESEVAVGGKFSANSARVQLDAAIAGLGIALLPELMTRAGLEGGALERVLPDYSQREVDVHFVYPSNRHIPRSVRAFADFAENVMVREAIVRPVGQAQKKVTGKRPSRQ
ncbi:LysR family transcriptional regulator [Pandoraea anhela]|uniref:LysR family transcriptional regulator n=1 Tax=Pandoraea anhela TaxID=2508295 RepID=A0A5E4RAE7_9BURK|nr:LysR family transcriptional regulator [Pandoraea anhela]VVD59009.1 LysR family transcriptional regulator [Pandoraea anhela]